MRVYLKKGDRVEALCTLEVENKGIQDFKFVEISEAAEGIKFSLYDGEHNYALHYDWEASATSDDYGRLFYDDDNPLD